jgi:hypothetical protein
VKTAKDFAKFAGQIGQLADLITPADSDPYEHALKLCVYHLRSAASQARQVAEALARTEPKE